MLAAAYLLGLQFAMVRARSRGLKAERVMDLGIWIIVSALVGAKLLLLDRRVGHLLAKRRRLLTLVRSAGVFYGGLIVAVAVALFYLWQLPHADVVGRGRRSHPASRSGTSIGRLGCFFAGCCFGRETSVPWAVTFHNEYAARNVGTPINVPLHPTQLYEAGAELLILGLLLATEKRGRTFPGRTFWAYMLMYGHLALHHRVLPRRRPRRDRHVLDVAVRVRC